MMLRQARRQRSAHLVLYVDDGHAPVGVADVHGHEDLVHLKDLHPKNRARDTSRKNRIEYQP